MGRSSSDSLVKLVGLFTSSPSAALSPHFPTEVNPDMRHMAAAYRSAGKSEKKSREEPLPSLWQQLYHCRLAGLYVNSGLIQKAPLTLTLGLPVTRLACGKFCECWHQERRSMQRLGQPCGPALRYVVSFRTRLLKMLQIPNQTPDIPPLSVRGHDQNISATPPVDWTSSSPSRHRPTGAVGGAVLHQHSHTLPAVGLGPDSSWLGVAAAGTGRQEKPKKTPKPA
ncbi:hypothetical protein D4764_11G0001410 [Takifugu flavidus]|uniref:Uncharacterized protein n=1 Tax=Takifugu flavidus TaxID=433684 RepID=A0A5C6PIC4_9TELE|nr:hypothetical protein D4764_11G0001410 [Takifugu flavidus]